MTGERRCSIKKITIWIIWEREGCENQPRSRRCKGGRNLLKTTGPDIISGREGAGGRVNPKSEDLSIYKFLRSSTISLIEKSEEEPRG